MNRPLALLILDGWGYSSQNLGNAIASSETPTISELKTKYPSLLLQASGASVGLTWGEPGNSEVGHLTIGAGRTVSQYSSRISRAISDGSFNQNPSFLDASLHALKHDSTLHIVGLIGSGTVHSTFEHLIALINLAKTQNTPKLKIHLFGDGKDSGLKESIALIGKLQAHLNAVGLGQIVTIVGRKYAMDRNSNWSWTQRAYDLITLGVGHRSDNIIQSIEEQYNNGLHDSDLEPICIDTDGLVVDNDAVIFFNFREDSMRQISRAFVEDGFTFFPVQKFSNLFVVFMTQYLEIPRVNFHIAFPPPDINNGLAEVLSLHGKKQLHLAETEKYAHVTYFFNGLHNNPYEGESDILIESSPDPAEKPEMQATKIADKFVEELDRDIFDFFVVNLANADILAHQGNLDKAIEGIKWEDSAIRQIYQAITAKNGILIIAADHGNAESMIYGSSGDVETKHNPNPIILMLIGDEWRRERTVDELSASHRKAQGIIADIAPTILELMGIQKPVEMTGESLLPILTS